MAGDALGGEEWGPRAGLEGPIHGGHAAAAGGVGTARTQVRPHLHTTAQDHTYRHISVEACDADRERGLGVVV